MCDGAYEAMTFERKACASIWKLLPDANGVPIPTAVPMTTVEPRSWLCVVSVRGVHEFSETFSAALCDCTTTPMGEQ